MKTFGNRNTKLLNYQYCIQDALSSGGKEVSLVGVFGMGEGGGHTHTSEQGG